jgi:bisphosphoglycerate-independent phosphoglycerate mutase (AlkP superfamily)
VHNSSDALDALYECVSQWRDTVTQDDIYANSRIMLVFTKIDLYKKHFHRIKFRKTFTDYYAMGKDQTFDFIVNKFLAVTKGNKNRVSVHVCDFTDEKQAMDLFYTATEISSLDLDTDVTFKYLNYPKEHLLAIGKQFSDVIINC